MSPHVLVVPAEEHHCSKDDDGCSSDCHEEALCTMLGIPSLAVITLDENDEHVVDETVGDSGGNQRRTLPTRQLNRMALPRNISRHGVSPQHCFAYTIDHFLSLEECQQLVQLGANTPNPSGGKGFDYVRTASHIAPDGSSYKVTLQNPNPHKLSVTEHASWTNLLWGRLEPILKEKGLLGQPRTPAGNQKPAEQALLPPLRLNPRIRILQYDASDEDYFAPHFDATTRVGPFTSLWTVLIYLNDGGGVDFVGGETLYLSSATSPATQQANATASDPNVCTRITPHAGRMVLFEHDLFHASGKLEWGRKHVLRTDVMFGMDHDAAEKSGAGHSHQESNMEDSSPSRGGESRGGPASRQHPPLSPRQETAEEHDQTVPGDDSGSSLTVQQMVRRLGILSKEQVTILREMDLLDVSLDTFCAPGRYALLQMLREASLSLSVARALINAAMEGRN